jgi:hypothetical protein
MCSLTLYDDRYGDDACFDPIPVALRELEGVLNDLGGDNTSMPDLDDLPPPQPPLAHQAPPPSNAIYQISDCSVPRQDGTKLHATIARAPLREARW